MLDEDSKEMGRGIIGFLINTFLVPIGLIIFILVGDMTLAMIFRWLPFTFGLILIGPSIYLVEVTGSRMYYLLGISAAVTGLLTSVLIDQGLLGFQYFMMGWSLVIFILGLVLFTRFIRTYPVIEAERD